VTAFRKLLEVDPEGWWPFLYKAVGLYVGKTVPFTDSRWFPNYYAADLGASIRITGPFSPSRLKIYVDFLSQLGDLPHRLVYLDHLLASFSNPFQAKVQRHLGAQGNEPEEPMESIQEEEHPRLQALVQFGNKAAQTLVGRTLKVRYFGVPDFYDPYPWSRLDGNLVEVLSYRPPVDPSPYVPGGVQFRRSPHGGVVYDEPAWKLVVMTENPMMDRAAELWMRFRGEHAPNEPELPLESIQEASTQDSFWLATRVIRSYLGQVIELTRAVTVRTRQGNPVFQYTGNKLKIESMEPGFDAIVRLVVSRGDEPLRTSTESFSISPYYLANAFEHPMRAALQRLCMDWDPEPEEPMESIQEASREDFQNAFLDRYMGKPLRLLAPIRGAELAEDPDSDILVGTVAPLGSTVNNPFGSPIFLTSTVKTNGECSSPDADGILWVDCFDDQGRYFECRLSDFIAATDTPFRPKGKALGSGGNEPEEPFESISFRDLIVEKKIKLRPGERITGNPSPKELTDFAKELGSLVRDTGTGHVLVSHSLMAKPLKLNLNHRGGVAQHGNTARWTIAWVNDLIGKLEDAGLRPKAPEKPKEPAKPQGQPKKPEYAYLGQCDDLRRGGYEKAWQEMMAQRAPVSANEFFGKVDFSELLDPDETIGEWAAAHPDVEFFRSTFDGEPCLFAQTRGFEFIWVKG